MNVQHHAVQLGKLGAIYVAFVEVTGGSYPDVQIPAWSGLAAASLGLLAIAALFTSGKIDDLFPDPRDYRIVQINAKGDPLAGWKLSQDKFEEMRVVWGPLYSHDDGPFHTFECYAYDKQRNVAVGTWKRSIPGSQLVGQFEVDDVLAVIGDLRGRLEPDARRVGAMRTALPAIVRELEYHRAEMQSSALDPSSPLKTDSPPIDDVIASHLPDELQPGHIRQGDLRSLLDAEQEDEPSELDGTEFEVLFEDAAEDALEPVGPLANDGGTLE